MAGNQQVTLGVAGEAEGDHLDVVEHRAPLEDGQRVVRHRFGRKRDDGEIFGAVLRLHGMISCLRGCGRKCPPRRGEPPRRVAIAD